MSLPKSFSLEDAGATRRLGREIARVLQPGDVVALSGDLGTGKTTLAQGIAEGLGVAGDVLSPTFTLMNEYTRARIPLLHVDAYRLAGVADVEQIGMEEYLENAWAMVVEWPERIAGALPEDHLLVTLTHDGDRRRATLMARGPQSAIQREIVLRRVGSWD